MNYIFLFLAAVFWGGNYVVGRILVEDTNPFLLSALRWIFTAILLTMIYHKQLRANLTLIIGSLRSIACLSILGQVLFPLTLYIGLQYTTSLNAAVYMSATPCVVLVINWLVFNDSVTKANIFGVIISTVGVLYLLFKGNFLDLEQLADNINQGDFWAIGSALSWAFYCSFLRTKDRRISGYAFVTSSSIIGALILIPAAIGYYLTFDMPPLVVNISQLANNPNFLLGLAYLVVFPSWLSYLFWHKGIMALGATRGEIFTHVIPLSGGIMSIIFLGAPVSYYHLVSALFILCGIYLCSVKRPLRSR